MAAALIAFAPLGLIGGLGFLAIRGVFSVDDQTDQSWTVPPPSETATIIDINDIRRKRAA